jgi:glutathione S-transferase
MAELVLTTYDWVPEPPRVRDLRVRWALEEAGLAYRVESTPFRDRKPQHFSHQPFGQVPWLRDGDLSIFESGAILLHLGERSAALMPADRRGRARVLSGEARLNRHNNNQLQRQSPLQSQGEDRVEVVASQLDHRLCHFPRVSRNTPRRLGAAPHADRF